MQWDDPKTQRTIDSIIHPIRDLHLEGSISPPPTEHFHRNGGAPKIQPKLLVIGALVIAALILVVTTGNYICLTVAGFNRRRKEISIREYCGASKAGLLKQFTLESTALILLAGLLASSLLPLLFALLSQQLGRDVLLASSLSLPVVLALLAGLLCLGVLCGVITAFILSRQPNSGHRAVGYRRRTLQILTIQQVAFSTALAIFTCTVFLQLHSFKSHDYGFDPENVVVGLSLSHSNNTLSVADLTAFLEEIQQSPNVVSATLTKSNILRGIGHRISFGCRSKISNSDIILGREGMSFNQSAVNTHPYNPALIDLLKVPLLAGRNISPRWLIENCR